MASPEEMAASMIANMPEKTGKPLEDWLKVVSASGLQKHGEIVKMLKTDHGMTHGFANLVAHSALKSAASTTDESSDDLVAAQYAGGKADLKPIYDAIIAYVSTLGGDVDIAPKKSSVSLRRSKQFALVTPATKTRIDLGINNKGREPEGRLEASKNAMCSHMIKLTTVAEFDDEVKAWVKEAYQNA
ncbi:MAG: phosphoribosylformylglycinamidine synthase [Ponticaulis sp.]|nr:phosphoribosylformylglycinamidine synthase [Ponticaulis sp.]|tara:strand:+ start:9047 stop:9607 length:561 start_codon:yes stop_codon:yes gene_type:complete